MCQISPLYNICINTQALHCPLSFSTGFLTASVASHAASKAESLLAFMYSLRTQSKRQTLCQLGISGKQVSSHFILYKSKHTPGLGLRTMPLQWDAIHLAPRCKCDGRVCEGACLHAHLNCAHRYLHAPFTCCSASVSDVTARCHHG